MSVTLPISKAQEAALMEDITCRATREVIADFGAKFKMFTVSQVCGFLNMSAKTLNELNPPIPKAQFGTQVRYRAADLENYIESRITR